MNLVSWRTLPAIVVLMQAALLVIFALNTRPLQVNGGLGYDGREYAAVTSWLRGDTTVVPRAPWSYRILPSAIVAASGLDVRLGSLALNVAAIMASSLVLLTMLRRDGAMPWRALTLILWYALLPTGLRFALAYPVLVDGVGIFLFISLLAMAQMGHIRSFVAALVLGSLTREHTVLFAPLAVRRDRWPGVLQAGAIAVPALAALLLVRALAPYPAQGGNMADLFLTNTAMLLVNFDGEMFRLLASPLLALGVLCCVAVALPRAVAATLSRPGWGYGVLAILVTGALGGRDHDRYFVWLAPFLMLAAARVQWSAPLGLALTALQVLATRVLVPLDGSSRDYLDFAIIGMPLDRLALWTSVAAASIIVGALMIRGAGLHQAPAVTAEEDRHRN